MIGTSTQMQATESIWNIGGGELALVLAAAALTLGLLTFFAWLLYRASRHD